MATGDKHTFGTFKVNGSKYIIPTHPWGGTPSGAPTNGNLASFLGKSSLELGDSDLNNLYNITWVEVNDGGKKLFICDRCLISYIKYSFLDSIGFVKGTEVVIDGKKYIVRCLTGGNNYASGTDAYSGAIPSTNEWERIILNEGNFEGLPKPSGTDIDATQEVVDFESAHNKFWNWASIGTRVQEYYSTDTTKLIYRGRNSAKYCDITENTSSSIYVGWRPVLEYLYDIEEPPSLVSIDSTLTNAVSSMGDTQRYIQYLNKELKYNLASKGVEVLESDKMSNLIDKVADLEQYNLPSWVSRNGLWVEAEKCPVTYSNMLFSNVGNKIYAFGGLLSSIYRNEIHEYDANLNTWIISTSVSPTYILSTSLAIPSVDKSFYVIGGYRNGSVSSDNDAFDTITKTWSSKAKIPKSSGYGAYFSYDNFIYVIGGSSSSSTSYAHKKNQCYDTITNTWTEKMASPVFFHQSLSCSVGNSFYIIGGTYYDTVEGRGCNYCYDMMLDTWTSKANIPIEKNYLAMGISAIGVNKEKIYVFSTPVMGGTFVYDTLTNSWVKDVNISSILGEAMAVSLDDGRIYAKNTTTMKCLVSTKK